MIGIVTVLYNSAPVLEDFFKSLNIQSFRDFILYVVDNSSTDDSLHVVEKLSGEVDFKTRILPQKENWGVAKGNNIGINAALSDGCSYILLSNNDIVMESTTIEHLFEGHVHYSASMSVPKIYFWNTEKIIWSAGGYWNLIDCTSRHYGYKKTDRAEYGIAKKIDYAPTCFMLINSGVFDKVGMMDEDFFVYYDDADFVWRATKIGDEKLYYIPDSQIWHKESFSTGGGLSAFTLFYFNRNRIYFSYKHLSGYRRYAMYLYLLIHYFFRDLFCMTKEQRRTYVRGLISGIKMARMGDL